MRKCLLVLAVMMVAGMVLGAVDEDFMMMAVRRTMEGDAERIAKHMFPKQEFNSVKTLPPEVKMKEIHPRKMVIKMSLGAKIEFMLTGRVNRKNTGGLPYTIEVLRVSNVKCINTKLKNKPILPDGAGQALQDVVGLVTEEAKKAALAAYPGEKVESVSKPKLDGLHDRRTGALTVKMSNGIQIDLDVVCGYMFDPKTNNIKPEFVGFEKATYKKGGVKDTPKKAIELIEEE